MKKFIMPAFILSLAVSAVLFSLSSKSYAQTGQDCRKIFDSAMSQCTKDYNACSDACSEKTKKPDGTAYFNSGEIYNKCMKASECHEKSSECNQQSLDNFRTCSSAKSEDKKNSPAEKQPGLPVFIGEWLSKFSQAVGGLTALPEAFSGIVYEDQLDLTPDLPTLEEVFQNFGTPPTLKDRFTSISFEEGKTKDAQMSFIDSLDSYSVTINKGGQYVTLNPGEEIPDGSTISVRKQALFRAGDHLFEVKPLTGHSEAVFHVRKNIDENSIRIEPFFNSGEVEVFKPKTTNDSWQVFIPFNLETSEAEVSSRQTYYSVSRNQDKKATLVLVYEGEVEVKTKDGKTTTVSPDGDEPGVVIVTQKLLVPKLAVAGLVLAGAIGGVILVLRKRFSKEKKRR